MIDTRCTSTVKLVRALLLGSMLAGIAQQATTAVAESPKEREDQQARVDRFGEVRRP